MKSLHVFKIWMNYPGCYGYCHVSSFDTLRSAVDFCSKKNIEDPGLSHYVFRRLSPTEVREIDSYNPIIRKLVVYGNQNL